ncbi:MAG TPA: DUF4160 domain-containing protein [Acidimicrobiia bacterium]
MPRLSEFYGIVIYMYWRDHPPAHFHAVYGEDEALVRIHDGAIIAGSIPHTARRLVEQWVDLHRTELLDNWNRAGRPEALLPIAPLR